MAFEGGSSTDASYVSQDGSSKIAKDDQVRLRIIGTRVDATEIVCFIGFLHICLLETSLPLGA